MAKSTTVISLPQMVDLALNSPEVGIVNFTVLHSLLHVIVNQLDLGECNVEFRGSDSERLQNYIATAKPGPLITLTEYTVGPDGQSRTPKTKKGKPKEGTPSGQKEKEIAILKQEDAANAAAETEREFQQTIVVVSKEKLDEPPKFAVAVTKEKFNKLSEDIRQLQQQVKELTDLPGNLGLIDALRSSGTSSKSSPVLDMFQILNLVKRLDATEVYMSKLASMMEDLAREHAHQALRSGSNRTSVSFKQEDVKPNDPQAGTSAAEVVLTTGNNPEAAALDLLVKSQELRGDLNAASGGTDLTSRLVEIDARLTEIENNIKSLNRGSISKKPRNFSAPDMDETGSSTYAIGSITEAETFTEGTQDFASLNLSKMPAKDAIAILQKELVHFKSIFMDSNVGAKALEEVERLKEAIMSGANQALPPDVKMGQMDLKMNELKEQVNHLDTVYHQQFEGIGSGIQHLEREISALWERINSGLPAGDATLGTEGQNVGELYNKLLQLQENMNTMSETATKLLSDREGRQNTLDVMIEQIELLKTVKADKEDLEDALADKADACQINRKVSHEQFDAAYDEISKALIDHLNRLQKQEEMWEEGLTEIQKEISGKLDKMELIPLRDFINSKLKMVQDKVKKISAMKEEYEAAGTKSKFLRNVNCISCDADVVMRKQNDLTMFPKPYAMPPSKNVGPYLAYELDQLRKQQKALPNSKNLNMFESAMNQAKTKPGDKDHLCNRYCGGSHTVTTPQQRVMRVGHFMEQWGPEIAPVKDVLIRGTDGHLYKGRDDSQLRHLAAEKAPTPRVESPAMIISDVPGYGVHGDLHAVKSNLSKPQSATGGIVTRSSLEPRPKTSAERVHSKHSVARGSGEMREIKSSVQRTSSGAVPTMQKSQDMSTTIAPQKSYEATTSLTAPSKPEVGTASKAEVGDTSNPEVRRSKEMSKQEVRHSLEKTPAKHGSATDAPRSSIEYKPISVAEVSTKRASQRSGDIKLPSSLQVAAPEEQALKE